MQLECPIPLGSASLSSASAGWLQGLQEKAQRNEECLLAALFPVLTIRTNG